MDLRLRCRVPRPQHSFSQFPLQTRPAVPGAEGEGSQNEGEGAMKIKNFLGTEDEGGNIIEKRKGREGEELRMRRGYNREKEGEGGKGRN